MREDPTRRMDVPPPPDDPGRPPREGPSPAMKAIVALLAAAVLGLGIALALVAGDSNDDDSVGEATGSVPAAEATTTQAQTTETASTASTEAAPTQTTSTPTASTSTASTATASTTTPESTATTETDSSGGIEVP